MRWAPWFAGALLTSVSACRPSCHSMDPECGSPQPGMLDLVLQRPAGSALDGAVLLGITGPGIDPGAVSTARFQSFSDGGGQEIHVIVVGADVQGIVATIRIADVRRWNEYSAVVRQVADAQGYGQKALSGYSVVIQRR